jgi:hypothetical protein
MLDGNPPPKEEFVAEENVNYRILTSEGAVGAEDDTVPASKLPPPPDPENAKHPDTLRQAPPTFNPSPPLKEAEEYSIRAPDNQALARQLRAIENHFKPLN